jgi:hypothetical protein
MVAGSPGLPLWENLPRCKQERRAFEDPTRRVLPGGEHYQDADGAIRRLGSLCLDDGCDRCPGMRAACKAAAIAMARPELSMLVTWDTDRLGDFRHRSLRQIRDTIHSGLDQVTGYLRKRYLNKVEFVSRIELGPQDDRPHVHSLHWGSNLRHSKFQEACRVAGFGFAKFEPVASRLGVACYIMKMALWSLMLESESARRVLEFDADLNGPDRLLATEDFFEVGPARYLTRGQKLDRKERGLSAIHRSALREASDPTHPQVLRVLEWVNQKPSRWFEQFAPPRLLATLDTGPSTKSTADIDFVEWDLTLLQGWDGDP